MTIAKLYRAGAALLGFACLPLVGVRAESVTLLANDKTYKVEAEVSGEDLWISPADLKTATGFEVKPEGACHDELCIPLGSDAKGLTRKAGDAKQVNVLGLARKIKQPVAADAEAKVWSLGPVPAVVSSSLQAGLAPDFELKDQDGKVHKLSDYRGKKVLVLTWASWCGCKLDLPGWEKVYEELKDKNFEIVAAAQDTAGFEAAGKYYNDAQAKFTALADPFHTVSSLYQMVNVPMGVWIDEKGRIVRPTEVAYSKKVKLGEIAVDGDEYVNALRDWVINGDKSPYVMKRDELKQKEAPRDEKLGQADAYFKLGVHFKLAGDMVRAEDNWKHAQDLNPDCWNYHRQDWSYTPREAMKNWNAKVKGLGDKPYYEPLALPKAEAKQ